MDIRTWCNLNGGALNNLRTGCLRTEEPDAKIQCSCAREGRNRIHKLSTLTLKDVRIGDVTCMNTAAPRSMMTGSPNCTLNCTQGCKNMMPQFSTAATKDIQLKIPKFNTFALKNQRTGCYN